METANQNTGPRKRRSLQRGSIFRRSVAIFPMLLLPVLIYLIMVMFAGQPSDLNVPGMVASLDYTLLQVPMISGVRWQLRAGDLLLLFGLAMLAIEIAKATSSKSVSIANHAASMVILLIGLILFLTVRGFATSTFFLLTMMMLFDVLAGAVVTIVSARRDFGVGDGIVS
ncbi:MAG: hypothetical protein AAF296_03540 [Pseudomonadota bacterium]